MVFDPSTAKPISAAFDPSTARPAPAANQPPGYLQSIGNAFAGAARQLGQDLAPTAPGETQKPLGQQLYDMTIGGVADAAKQGGDILNLINAPLKAAVLPPITAASNALYDAGIRPSVGVGGPSDFHYQALNRQQAADQLGDIAMAAASLGAPARARFLEGMGPRPGGGALGLPAGAPASPSSMPPRIAPAASPSDLAATLRARAASDPFTSADWQPAQPVPVAGVPRMAPPGMPAATPPARPPWMPSDEEIDASWLPNSGAAPTGAPAASVPPAGPTSPQAPASAGPPRLSSGTPTSGAPSGPPRIGASTQLAPATPGGALTEMTPQRLAAWKLFERDAKGAGGVEAALMSARPWQTAAEAAGGSSRDMLQALANVGELPTRQAVGNLVSQRLAAVPDAVRGAASDFLGMDPSEAPGNVREYLEQERAVASPMYEDDLYNPDQTPAPDSPLLRELSEHPVISKYLNEAARLGHRPNRPAFATVSEMQLPDSLPSGGRLPSPMGRRAGMSGDEAANASLGQQEGGITPTVNHVNIPTMRTWDKAKQMMDNDIGGLLDKGEVAKAAELSDLRSWLVKNEDGSGVAELDRLVPKYAGIRAAGGTAPSAEAYANAADRMFGDNYKIDKFAQEAAKMTVPQKQALLAGHLDRVENYLGTKENGAIPGNKNLGQYTSVNYQKKLAYLVGDRPARAYVNAIRDIEESRQSALELMPTQGSKSARILAAAKQLSTDMQGGLPTGEQVGEAVSDLRKAAGKAVGNVLVGQYNKAAYARTLPVQAERGRIMALPAQDALAEYQTYKAARGGRAQGTPRTGRSGPPKLP